MKDELPVLPVRVRCIAGIIMAVEESLGVRRLSWDAQDFDVKVSAYFVDGPILKPPEFHPELGSRDALPFKAATHEEGVVICFDPVVLPFRGRSKQVNHPRLRCPSESRDRLTVSLSQRAPEVGV